MPPDKLAFLQERDVSRCQELERRMLRIVWDFGSHNAICKVWINVRLPTGIEQTQGESVGGPQTVMPDTLFARPNNRHNHVHHWSLETQHFQLVFKLFLSMFFHWLRCKVTSWWHVQPVVHVTTRLISPELTRSTTFVWNIGRLNRVRHGSLGV